MNERYVEANHNHCPRLGFTRRSIWICITALAWLLVSAPGARADAQYCYAGSNFIFFSPPSDSFTTNDKVSGCVILASALPANSSETSYSSSVLSISFSAGPNVSICCQLFNDARFTFHSTLQFGTNDGQITSWDLTLWDRACFFPDVIDCKVIGSSSTLGDFAFDDHGDEAVSGSPGLWTQVAPEPSSFILLMLGISALAGMTCRARQLKQATPSDCLRPLTTTAWSVDPCLQTRAYLRSTSRNSPRCHRL